MVRTYALLLIYRGQQDRRFIGRVVLLFYNRTDAAVIYFMARKGTMSVYMPTLAQERDST